MTLPEFKKRNIIDHHAHQLHQLNSSSNDTPQIEALKQHLNTNNLSRSSHENGGIQGIDTPSGEPQFYGEYLSPSTRSALKLLHQ